MGKLNILKGNIFTSKAEVLVNTVNCVGVMGAGIALEFRLRYPKLYEAYKLKCQYGEIQTGQTWLYEIEDPTSTIKAVLNFPTKNDWKQPSKERYLHDGLEHFANTIENFNYTSIAFPMLGAQKGGLTPEVSLGIMQRYLQSLSDRIEISIYQYDQQAKDDLFDAFYTKIMQLDSETVAKITRLSLPKVDMLYKYLNAGKIVQINQLLKIPGIGLKSLEKLFFFAMDNNISSSVNVQNNLF